MMDQEEVFFYDEENECVSSLTRYHAEECSIEPLVEAHPDVIYFYATFGPLEEPEIDYNTTVMMSGHGVMTHTYSPYCPQGCRGQMEGCYYKPEVIHTEINDVKLLSIGLDAHPNAFGYGIEVQDADPVAVEDPSDPDS